jgi:hypothetical protein
MAEDPEKFLEYVDWMGITLTACPLSLDRFKGLPAEQVELLNSSTGAAPPGYFTTRHPVVEYPISSYISRWRCG